MVGPGGGKLFGRASAMDQMPNNFAALNLAVGPMHNKVDDS